MEHFKIEPSIHIQSKKWNNLTSDSLYPNQVLQTSAKKSNSASNGITAKKGTFKTKSNVNVRSAAGTTNKIVAKVKKGTTLTVSQQKKWGMMSGFM